MRLFILLISTLLPIIASAKIPEMEALCEKYEKHKHIKCDNIGRFLLRTYATFLPKADKPVFQSLDNITMLECKDSKLSTEIKQEAEAIHEPFLRRHVERCTAIIICLIDRNAGRGEQEPDAFHVVTECC